MAQDEGKQEEEKFDFTREGEVLGYISLDQARVLAMRTAREAPGDYGRRFRDSTMAFDVVEADETEDHYVITISFRPEGEFAGRPGREQFFIEKEGAVALRQVLGLPGRTGWRRIPLGLVAIGLVAVVGAVIGGVFAATSGGEDNGLQSQAVASPTSLPEVAVAALTTASTTAPVAVPPVVPTAPPTPARPSSTAVPLLAPTPTPLPATTLTPPTNAINDAAPPSGSVAFRDHYYLTVPQPMTWVNAVAYSNSLGGHLVTISDEDENRFVADLAQEKGLPQTFWIGLSDEVQEGSFLWVTGESSIYSNWYSGEPNNEGNEDYVEMGFETRYTWNDKYADRSQPFVVEFEPRSDGGAIVTTASTPNFTVTALPESSATWPLDDEYDGFVSQSDDPLAPWSGTSVQFRGSEDGGSAERLGAASLVYRYRLEFDQVGTLSSVSVAGAAFNGPDSILRVLDENMDVLGSVETFGENSFLTHTVEIPNVRGTVFFIDEFDTSGSWRYRESITVNGLVPERDGDRTAIPADAVPFRGNWYLVVSASTGWEQAKRHAEFLGGHLVTIGDEAENLFVAGLAEAQGLDTIRIGLTDQVSEGSFVWANGEALSYTNWPPGQPDNARYGATDEDYVELITFSDDFFQRLQWNDVPDFTVAYVVEFEGYPIPILPPAGLVAWWPGEGNANDIVGGNNGTLMNGATFAPGVVGQAFSFDGDGYVDAGNDPTFDLTNALTLVAWIRTDGTEGHQTVVSYYSPYEIGFFDYKLEFLPGFVGGASTVHREAPGGTVLVGGAWYHVAVTWDGATITSYVNGEPDRIASYNNSLNAGSKGLNIGRASTGIGYFKGLIDEVTIYNRALTTDEIKAVYDAGSAGMVKP